MITQIILTTVGMFIAISLKTMQGRSIANKNMKLIPIVSYFICLLELTVYGAVLLQGASWSILVVSLGAALGSVCGVMAADILNDKIKGEKNDSKC